MDFYKLSYKNTKTGVSVYPEFIVGKSKDLMIKGGKFYAVWDEENQMWSTDEFMVAKIIDEDIDKHMTVSPKADIMTPLYMSIFSSGSWKQYKQFIQMSEKGYYKPLDSKITFRNTVTKKSDYISKKLPYDLESGPCPAYERIISTLYEPKERAKIEWAIGAIISGDSKKIQKFIVLYGPGGTGKSTILNIIGELFEGYTAIFNAKELATGTNNFAGDAFANNPLVAIQHDGDLSQIRDNSVLNTIVAHEDLIINEKYKSKYSLKINSFLFMGTNKPVRITDSKSGLIRRVIDVRPSGIKLDPFEYDDLIEQIPFELGHIANHCLEVYKKMGMKYYNNYKPMDMMYETDPFFNFVESNYYVFEQENGISLKRAYSMYKQYCDDGTIEHKLPMFKFRTELANYFDEFLDEYTYPNGQRCRSYFKEFKKEMFEQGKDTTRKYQSGIILDSEDSIFDSDMRQCPAQLANEHETPTKKWADVDTVLADIDTSKVHYVKLPENHIVIDFDLKDETGNKSLQMNLEAASKWPATYAEISKGGAGVHLHYIYTGDATELSRVYDDNIEIKVFTGNSSLRRKLTKCNSVPITTISSGLPLRPKGEKVVNFEATKTEKGLRTLVLKNLNKEYHNSTKCSIDFIYEILDRAYESDLKYDITDMRPAVTAFAAKSSHQADNCLKLVQKMKFKSEDPSDSDSYSEDSPLVFFDVEVIPNLFLVNWKFEGKGKDKVIRMFNPSPSDIESLLKYRLIGFNNRRYDNHIMYARYMGYTNEQLYMLSQRIINGDSKALFGEAYNLSYTDIYDYSSKKQSLKKWEIELGIHHQELGLDWNKPVPEKLWGKIAEYCDNDVIATEAVWNATQGDFIAREILADVCGRTVNDTTNSLTTRIIFGDNRNPQTEFNYRFMGEPEIGKECRHLIDGYTCFQEDGKPVFEGYEFNNGISTYRGEEVGEGGYVYANPGMYGRAITLDVASMHPSSIIAENLFGDEYTKRFQEILQARIYIKHKEFDKAKDLLNGSLTKYLKDPKKAKALAQALKIAINSVYGLTAARFTNPMKDPRNIDNIVAKRGALFMINLRHAVEDKGYTVIHVKTDSIKIADPTPEIIDFVVEYGKLYGYNFEVEHIFEKICLVNNAVYIAKLAEDDEEWIEAKEEAEADNKPIPTRWTATGAQFAQPYVFKTLFSKERIKFDDLCETKSVTGDLYLDLNEDLPDVSNYEKLRKLRMSNKPIETMTKKDAFLLDIWEHISDEELDNIISEGHNYRFVGKVGRFCPIKPGKNGGLLLRFKDGVYSSATGAKDFRWAEAELVKDTALDDIDRRYHQRLVDEAIDTISKYGDFEQFAN